tara:strand:+ start:247 stop:1074 length:828 start_codon:yes stop_codon:yes gene_type:complete
MIKVLELFSGTGSVGKCCKKLDWDVVSVDLLLPADHEVDILEFDYKQYPKDNFDIVWASPPCTYYSSLQNCWLGRKKKDGILVTKELIEEQRKEADKLVAKALEIIDYFKPELWFIENPATGKLKDREVVKGLPFYDVSYCMYSDWGYEKKTRIWTNKKDWENLICDKSGACGNMVESQHKTVLGNGYEIIDGKKVLCNTAELRKKYKHKLNVANDVHTVGARKTKYKHKIDVCANIGGGSQKNEKKDLKYLGKGTNRIDRYRVPEDLIFSLFLD